jgi:acyl-coenzyme A synthetase/AMP-(fatty) acid ligase
LVNHVPWIVETVGVDTVLHDAPSPDQFDTGEIATEWVLFTSGTTGRPKMVLHTLDSLSGPVSDGITVPDVWGTFYDVRRYGGLQILLRALIGGGSMVLCDEPMADFLPRASRLGVMRISGTPSHWRRALQLPELQALRPNYVRMSGEIADQPTINRLRRAFPMASVDHAFATSEAGVGFTVQDFLAGFPASFLPHPNDNTAIEMKIEDGSLRLRSARVAKGYLGGVPFPISEDGFVDTNDLVLFENGRYYFQGRREGVINLAGLKVFPEEVEDVLISHPMVRMARVRPLPSKLSGQIVAADIVPLHDLAAADFDSLCNELRSLCVATLTAHKAPIRWFQVDSIELGPSGKVKRGG